MNNDAMPDANGMVHYNSIEEALCASEEFIEMLRFAGQTLKLHPDPLIEEQLDYLESRLTKRKGYL